MDNDIELRFWKIRAHLQDDEINILMKMSLKETRLILQLGVVALLSQGMLLITLLMFVFDKDVSQFFKASLLVAAACFLVYTSWLAVASTADKYVEHVRLAKIEQAHKKNGHDLEIARRNAQGAK